MKNHRVHVGILFGGKSAEHEISVKSAQNVLAALDTTLFQPILIYISKQGTWHHVYSFDTLPTNTRATSGPNISLLEPCDVVFPLLHGPLGEDGTIQGLLELTGKPYVGCNVASSAIGMDKDLMKRLLREARIPVADSVTLFQSQYATIDTEHIIKKLGLPLFIKPANMGSSIGVNRAATKREVAGAITTAFRYDNKVLVEKAIIGDEIECGILGNEKPLVSVPGRILSKDTFYTYHAKYHDTDKTILEVPAKLPAELIKKIQAVALKTFAALGCKGLARVDMFITKKYDIFVNEINTMPGFTSGSMYPLLIQASGIPYPELLTQLIQLAMQSAHQKQQPQTTFGDSVI